MSTIDATFGQHVKRLRKARDLTQRDLAQAVGCTEDLIRKIESGRRKPSRELAQLLAVALKISADERDAFVDAARASAPAQMQPAAPTGNLPALLAPTFGRDAELRRISNALTMSGARLLTLTGAGGVGKTQLALVAARSVAPGFADGVWWVALDAISSPAFVWDAIAAALGVQLSSAQDARDSVVAALAGQRRLLVLDNFEHVAAAAPELAALLEACAGVTLLVTSRERLKLSSEHVIALRPLACAAPDADSGAIAESPAARLFAERAARLDPEFAIGPHNAARVASICRAVDGLPLALCIVAARAGMHSLESIGAELLEPETQLDFVDLPERQRSLRQAIAWSYRHLDPAERSCLRRLSVMNGATLDGAAAVCATPLIEQVLQSLIDKSLLNRETHSGVLRFRQLAPVREAARALLRADATEEIAALEAMAAHITARIEMLYARYASGAPDMDREWERFEADLDNLRVVAGRALASGDAARYVALSSASRRMMWVRGHAREGLAMARVAVQLLDDERQTTDPSPNSGQADRRPTAVGEADRLRADAYGTLGTYLLDLDDASAGIAYLRMSVALATAQGMDRRAISSLINFANGQASAGAYDEALAACDTCADLCRRVDDDYGLADVEACRGLVAFFQGDLPRSRAGFERARAIHQRMRNRSAELIVTSNLAVVCEHMGDLSGAIEMNTQCLALAREGGMPSLIAGICGNLASETLALGDLLQTRRYLTEALDVALRAGELLIVRNAFVTAAQLALRLEEPERAAECLGMAYRARAMQGVAFEPDAQQAIDALATELGELVEPAIARYALADLAAMVAAAEAGLSVQR